MASLRFTDVQARPTEFLDFTSLTLEEFQTLVPPFEALRTLGDAPARSLTALAQRLGVSEADGGSGIAPPEEEPVPLTTARASPLLPMTAPSGGSSAPKTLLHRPSVIAARKKTIR